MTRDANQNPVARQETLLRQIALLQAIPREPRRITTLSLRAHLDAEGYAPSLRTIQRDLERLAGSLPLVCNRSVRPFGWMWARDAPGISVPAPDPDGVGPDYDPERSPADDRR